MRINYFIEIEILNLIFNSNRNVASSNLGFLLKSLIDNSPKLPK
jgi:hypothetical protein